MLIELRMKEIEEGRGRVSKGGTTNLCKRKKKSRNKKVWKDRNGDKFNEKRKMYDLQ